MKISASFQRVCLKWFFIQHRGRKPIGDRVRSLLYSHFVLLNICFGLIELIFGAYFQNTSYEIYNSLFLVFWLFGIGMYRWLKRDWVRESVLISASCLYLLGGLYLDRAYSLHLITSLLIIMYLVAKGEYFFFYVLFIGVVFVVGLLTGSGFYSLFRPDSSLLSIISLLHGLVSLSVCFVSIKYVYIGTAKEIQRANNQLKEARYKCDQMLQYVAHDLRSPIGAISNYLNLIQCRYEHVDAERKILKSMMVAPTHSLDLLNDLKLVEMKPSESASFDITEVTRQAIEIVQLKAKLKNQTISLSNVPDSLVVFGSADRIRRVLVNLLDNAIKFSFANGKISVVFKRWNGNVLTSVIDNGIGLPGERGSDIFNTLSFDNRAGIIGENSNGLGLLISRKIVEAHGVSFIVVGNSKGGTTFTIMLPAADGEMRVSYSLSFLAYYSLMKFCKCSSQLYLLNRSE